MLTRKGYLIEERGMIYLADIGASKPGCQISAVGRKRTPLTRNP